MEALGIDWKLLIGQAVNFLILFGLLSWLLYKPVIKLLVEREKKVKDASDLAEKTKIDSQKIDIELQEKLNKAKQEAKEIISLAQDSAKLENQKLIKEAQKESAEIIARSQKQIAVDQEELRKKLHNEVAVLTVATVAKILGKKLPKVDQDNLQKEAVKIIK
jgi:F-type H+-transporting ATPase subunit b